MLFIIDYESYKRLLFIYYRVLQLSFSFTIFDYDGEHTRGDIALINGIYHDKEDIKQHNIKNDTLKYFITLPCLNRIINSIDYDLYSDLLLPLFHIHTIVIAAFRLFIKHRINSIECWQFFSSNWHETETFFSLISLLFFFGGRGFLN